ncbi:glutaredoxin-like protein NrdH [Lactobacillus sp. S2-2]|uniref:glutaredoxin-like protein NrdH n=1 Tax=Lactobacillus sp. S2-2 TaxID=2692917 RepID=UPI001F032265|nr:glutaredoxin-like protein NrdH [Lactobacillus sp. S2-2]MCF6515654.1 glutaredoxin-like protein NrdH [Lactobacillus sp. S2-2]
MPKIAVYTKENCMQCKMTKRFLTEKNVEFEEKDTTSNPEYVSFLKENGFLSLPVVEVDGQPQFSNFRPDALKELVG